MNKKVCLALTPLLLSASLAQADIYDFTFTMSGPAESPPNASLGTGLGTVSYNDFLHTMAINLSFSGLTGTTTLAHIHAATANAGTGTAGVATPSGSFTTSGFPLGVTSGVFNNTYDMTLASSFSASYLTANGGTPASAEAALIAASTAGKAYFNIHTSAFGGGEIRGFLTPVPEPATASLLALGGASLGLARRRRK